MITQAELVKNVFQFLRVDLLKELRLQIVTRVYNEPNFDEIFEHRQFELMSKVSDFVERQAILPEPVQSSTLNFPTAPQAPQPLGHQG